MISDSFDAEILIRRALIAHLFEIRMPSQWQTACGATGMNAKESDYAIS
jgi:hypothetical protein